MKQDKDLTINDLIKEIDPVPTHKQEIEFEYGDVSTHKQGQKIRVQNFKCIREVPPEQEGDWSA